MNRKLKERATGVVTGASTGIGQAVAIILAKKLKARLIINARTEEALAFTKAEIEKYGGEAVICAGNVADQGMAASLVERCFDAFGSVDILVNNAGIATPGRVVNLTPADWEKVFAVNFFAPLHATYAALPHFAKNKFGKIVNIASVAGKVALPGSVCYAASKFALTGMSEGMAAELEQTGIDVITVCPGWVRTEFFAKNHMIEAKNPTLIAKRANLSGFLMKHMLSISSEQAAVDIYRAIQKGGGQEIVLTAVGIAVERVHGFLPKTVADLAKLMPASLVDSSNVGSE